MQRKLIFFDIDGTLIGGGTQTIPGSAIRAITRARENGHLCFINTGRTKALVGEEITGQVEFDGILLGCGTMILYHNQELFHQVIPPEMGQRILDCLPKYKVDAIMEGADANYGPDPDQFFTETFFRYICPDGVNYGPRPFAESLGRFDKFFSYVDHKEQMEAFRKEFVGEFDFIDRENGFYEVVPCGFSKATGMRFMAEKLHVSMEDTVAVGDSNNDMAMFECAGTRIAMQKSSGQILKMADFVTTDVWEDGIWNALEWLGVL